MQKQTEQEQCSEELKYNRSTFNVEKGYCTKHQKDPSDKLYAEKCVIKKGKYYKICGYFMGRNEKIGSTE